MISMKKDQKFNYNKLLIQCYFLQLKKAFPQSHYNKDSLDRIHFYIPNLNQIMVSHYIFMKNKYIWYLLSTCVSMNIIYFHYYLI